MGERKLIKIGTPHSLAPTDVQQSRYVDNETISQIAQFVGNRGTGQLLQAGK
jgi:hypothetical protein